jgi:hypothetical protein
VFAFSWLRSDLRTARRPVGSRRLLHRVADDWRHQLPTPAPDLRLQKGMTVKEMRQFAQNVVMEERYGLGKN